MPFGSCNQKKYEMQSGLRNPNYFDIYIKKITPPVLQFQLLSLSLSLPLIPKFELHKSVQTWSFLLKITAFKALTNIKLTVSSISLCMQVNMVDFFSCALKLFEFHFPNYIVAVRIIKSGLHLCNFIFHVLCCVVLCLLC